ncbi:phage tail protein [Nitratidesulfovibrio liaohensis]|uniref:Phage tail protein n=1 Tax=Nitratidesulfovibrio liaohensis TaxID=2604158 RepID=A0ABY9R1X2_9BACT|nr:phage tail protein [Nitratidesulfovibrio liaohensis]WMW65751.1 phage tail protein [Nitratidesulfovibrio liaohensis]
MQLKYSPATNGFYVPGVHDVPGDALDVTEEEHLALRNAQVAGMFILPGPDGRPMAVAPAGPTLEEIAAAKAREIRAGFDTALSGVLAGADATATGVAVGSALMAVTDPEGLEYLVERLTARRVALEQALLQGQTGKDIAEIHVSYPT